MLDYFSMNTFLVALFFLVVFIAAYRLSVRATTAVKLKKIMKRDHSLSEIVNNLYGAEFEAFVRSVDYRKEKGLDDAEFTYGEIAIPTFLALLEKTDPKPGDVFYDLGCGGGKAVFLAALKYPFLKVKGIELIPPLVELCHQAKKQLEAVISQEAYLKNETVNIDFIEGNILEADFSDGTIFFLNATCFSDENWSLLQNKLAKLSKGVRIIVMTKQFDDDDFELIDSGTYPMSWGLASAYVYRKVAVLKV